MTSTRIQTSNKGFQHKTKEGMFMNNLLICQNTSLSYSDFTNAKIKFGSYKQRNSNTAVRMCSKRATFPIDLHCFSYQGDSRKPLHFHSQTQSPDAMSIWKRWVNSINATRNVCNALAKFKCKLLALLKLFVRGPLRNS